MSKQFTADEASALVPALTSALERIATVRAELEGHLEAFRGEGVGDVASALGDLDRVPPRHRERFRRVKRLAELIESEIRLIHESGAVVKDLDLGLVDFPGVVGGREVYLCWRIGEPDVRFWHDLDKGFRFRKPLLRVINNDNPLPGPAALN